jgi:hypothetical protein
MISDSEKNIQRVQEFVEETLGETLTIYEAVDFIMFFNSLIDEMVIVHAD